MRRAEECSAAAAAAVIFAAALLLMACERELDGRDRLDPWYRQPLLTGVSTTGLLEDRSGIQIRDISGPPIVVIGAREGDSRYLFSEISDLLVRSAAQETIYVLDRRTKRIAVFDKSGTHVLDIGKRGRGPGEYVDPRELMELPWNSHIGVWDDGLRRLTVLESGGNVVQTITMPPEPGKGLGPLSQRPGRRIRAVADGFVVEARSPVVNQLTQEQRGYLIHSDTTLSRRDTVLAYRVNPVVQSFEDGGNVMYVRGPKRLAPISHWEALSDGTVLFSPGTPLEVYIRKPDGRPMHLVDRKWSLAEIGLEDRLASLVRQKQEGIIKLPDSISIRDVEPDARELFGTIRPAVTGLILRSDSGFWIQDFDAANLAQGQGRNLYGYDLRGRLVSAIRLPAHFRPIHVRCDRVYGVYIDDFGVQYVHVYTATYNLCNQ